MNDLEREECLKVLEGLAKKARNLSDRYLSKARGDDREKMIGASKAYLEMAHLIDDEWRFFSRKRFSGVDSGFVLSQLEQAGRELTGRSREM